MKIFIIIFIKTERESILPMKKAQTTKMLELF
jgi:hypothetical protein